MPARVRLLPVVLVVLVTAPAAWGGGGTGIATPIDCAVDIANASRQNNSDGYACIREAVPGARDLRLGTADMHGFRDVVHRVEKPRAQRTTGDSS